MDFEQKNIVAQAERRKIQQRTTNNDGEMDQQKQRPEGEEKLTLDTEEETPENPDEQWSVLFTVAACWNVSCESKPFSLNLQNFCGYVYTDHGKIWHGRGYHPGVKVLNLILIGEGVALEPPPQISKFCRCGMLAWF